MFRCFPTFYGQGRVGPVLRHDVAAPVPAMKGVLQGKLHLGRVEPTTAVAQWPETGASPVRTTFSGKRWLT